MLKKLKLMVYETLNNNLKRYYLKCYETEFGKKYKDIKHYSKSDDSYRFVKSQKYYDFFKDLVDEINRQYNSYDLKELNYKKKQYEVRYEREYGTDLTANFGMLISIMVASSTFFFTIINSLKNNVKDINIANKISEYVINGFVITISVVFGYVIFITIGKMQLSRRKSFLLLCISVLEEVEEEKKEEIKKVEELKKMEELRLLEEQKLEAKEEVAVTSFREAGGIIKKLIKKLIR